MNKILIFTFTPFKHYKRNSAQDLVMRLPNPDIYKLVLKTDYNPQPLLNKIDELKPDLILGIGQSTERFVKVETIFTNRKKSWDEKVETLIGKNEYYQSNFDIQKIAEILQCQISQNAGRQNCNFMMYRVLEKINKEKLTTKAGFIHVPNTKYFAWTKYLPKFEELINRSLE